MSYQLNEKLRDLTPYDPIEGSFPIRLDANEAYFNLNDELAEVISVAANKVALNRYPDPYAREVCQKFAALYGLNPELVTAGNGSDELISIILAGFLQKGDKVLTLTPDFSMYRFYAEIYEAIPTTYSKEQGMEGVLAALEKTGAKAVIFSNPCNPSGTGFSKDEVLKLVTGTDALVILDEAYMDFWDQSLLDCVGKYDNLIILKTCSKALGMAAIRLGFAVCPEVITKAIRAVKSPYNVNSLTQSVGAALLSDVERIHRRIDALIESRNALFASIKPLETSPVIQSVPETVTNFIVIYTEYAAQIHQALLKKGIAVRKFPAFLRITAGTPAENEAFVTAFREIIKELEGR